MDAPIAESTYLFYDLETSGLDKSFDQVLQFAAIRTDQNFNELEQYELFIRLNPETVPSPSAILTNKISHKQLANGTTEYEAMLIIHRLFNQPGTITVGYNSLGFDDEFLLFSFHRNLLDPYSHQYANGCNRLDIYPIAVLYYLFNPGALVFPRIDGQATFKLEYLSAANQPDGGPQNHLAHNALYDARATLNLARKLKEKDESMWRYLLLSFHKKTDIQRWNQVASNSLGYREGLLISGIFGANNQYQTNALYLGHHLHYTNQTLWLRLDQKPLAQINSETIVEHSTIVRKRFGEPPILLPPLERFTQRRSSEASLLIAHNRNWLIKNPEQLEQLKFYYRHYKYPEIPDLDIDAALYQNGFMSSADREQCKIFHQANAQQKISLINKFQNDHLRTQALRIMGRNYPEVLARESCLQQEFRSYLKKFNTADPILNYKGENKLSIDQALLEADQLRRHLALDTIANAEQLKHLQWLVEYLSGLSKVDNS